MDFGLVPSTSNPAPLCEGARYGVEPGGGRTAPGVMATPMGASSVASGARERENPRLQTQLTAWKTTQSRITMAITAPMSMAITSTSDISVLWASDCKPDKSRLGFVEDAESADFSDVPGSVTDEGGGELDKPGLVLLDDAESEGWLCLCTPRLLRSSVARATSHEAASRAARASSGLTPMSMSVTMPVSCVTCCVEQMTAEPVPRDGDGGAIRGNGADTADGVGDGFGTSDGAGGVSGDRVGTRGEHKGGVGGDVLTGEGGVGAGSGDGLIVRGGGDEEDDATRGGGGEEDGGGE